METEKWMELALYTLPAVVTGGVAYLMMQKFVNLDENRRKFQLLRDNQKQALPIRLQAYERMALFLERINPLKLMIRVAPFSNDTTDYMNLLIQNIEQEYEHNVTQQIYLSDEAWVMVVNAKNAIIQNLRNLATDSEIKDADQYRMKVLSSLMETESASQLALEFLKSEIKDFI
ncbi:hypothetical protein SAMN05444377_1041 [Flavobacterium fontis]|jgi:hypothetical protein|uniref:Uncharacterized protein n=1 Tax=Flavobacterium fontis TaxID=1124188 RepID=A0A1M4Z0W0_9FLAO|nr:MULTISPECIES: hypothetical protein [Flavobacterium]MCZ8168702.1 hypothetical protein [Flavobacterium sp.]MCZ8296897.1 hypothetical protein [Flavobacterium sp.]SHF11713.1 hypothetical protein SAMN05444377_1041 [Flavobacterium fontis]